MTDADIFLRLSSPICSYVEKVIWSGYLYQNENCKAEEMAHWVKMFAQKTGV